MYSGKSTELIRRVNRFKSIGKKVLVINHNIDNRYTNEDAVVSHSGSSVESIKSDSIENINVCEYDVIAIDEGQFFEDLYPRVLFWTDEHQKTVVIAGLSGDFQRKTMGQLLSLIPHCDDLSFTRAYCSSCRNGTHATFTLRLTDDTEQVVVGTTDMYMAVCRSCYLKQYKYV
jgi:thymidine kinase